MASLDAPSASMLQSSLEELTLSTFREMSMLQRSCIDYDTAHDESHSCVAQARDAKPLSATSAKRKTSLMHLQQRMVLVSDCYTRASIASNALSGGGVARCTERDLYYMHPTVFPSQVSVTHSIRNLCDALNELNVSSSCRPHATNTFTWTRGALAIDATAKSILASSGLVIDLAKSDRGGGEASASHQRVNVGSFGPAGIAIGPAFVDAIRNIAVAAPPATHEATLHTGISGTRLHTGAPLLVVVEKESTLQHLLRVDCLWEKAPYWSFLCVKGFPCAASRSFLRVFHQVNPDVPIVVLCDGDVFGAHIAWCLMRTACDDFGWYNALFRKKRSIVFAEEAATELPTTSAKLSRRASLKPAATVVEGSAEWLRFVQFIGAVHYLGLTATQAASLAAPSDLSAVPQNELNRAKKLSSELHQVQQLLLDAARLEHPPVVQAAAASAAICAIQRLVDALQGVIDCKRKAELQSLSRHHLGIIGALVSFERERVVQP